MISLTARLWHALRATPPYHPLSQLTNRYHGFWSGAGSRYRLIVSLVFFGLFMVGLAIAPQMAWTVFFGFILIIPLSYIALNGTLQSAQWSAAIAAAIARAHRRGAYDVLAVIPEGGLGLAWQLAVAVLRRHDALGVADEERAFVARLVFGLAVLLCVITLALREPDQPDTTDQILLLLWNLLTFTVAIRIDDVHSLVTGTLIGMLVPTYSAATADARVWAPVAFLVTQFTAYGLTFVVGFILAPGILAALHVSEGVILFTLPLLRLTVFFALREFVVRMLWVTLCARLNDSGAFAVPPARTYNRP